MIQMSASDVSSPSLPSVGDGDTPGERSQNESVPFGPTWTVCCVLEYADLSVADGGGNEVVELARTAASAIALAWNLSNELLDPEGPGLTAKTMPFPQ